jgi:hypothetical protein
MLSLNNITFRTEQFSIVLTKYSEDYPEDGSVYEPKHVARNTTKTYNKLRVVYDCTISYHTYSNRTLNS